METARPGRGAPTLVPGLDGGLIPRHQYHWNRSWKRIPQCGGGIGCVSPAVTRDMGWADAQE